MLISNIQTGINNLLAGERLPIREMIPHIDSVIDDINRALNSTYPVFSELADGTTQYQYFPDLWIRQVIFPGAAYYFYQRDEEGVDLATGLQGRYYQNLFYMTRDYAHAVPEEYQDNPENGMVIRDDKGSYDVYGISNGDNGVILP